MTMRHLIESTSTFWLPHEKPNLYQTGERVELHVKQISSVKTFIPIEYYRLPFCRPSEDITTRYENLGASLLGDRVQNSAYSLLMKTDMFCEHVCVTNLGHKEQVGMSTNDVIKEIRTNYQNNWILDNLPAASKMETDKQITYRYWQGFPIGFVDKNTNLAYIYNHVNIEIMYGEVETGPPGHYYVSRFTVAPFSIKHDIEPISLNDTDNTHFLPTNYKIRNPIQSCNPQTSPKKHTSYEMVTERGREAQPASGPVLFTYDVIWQENQELNWASRWDVYLTMDNAIPAGINIPDLTIVFVLAAGIAAILIRNLRRDLHRYHRVAQSEEGRVETQVEEESGWKLVQADVFRPPANPLRLSNLCGTGAQLLGMTLFIVLLSACGYISQAKTGHVVTVALFLFALLGGINGYVTARLYKTFHRESSWRAVTFTSLAFPGISFGMFFFTNFIAMKEKSSAAVPFTTILTLLALWLGISVPMVFVGAVLGYRQSVIGFPLDTSDIPRPIPDRKCSIIGLTLMVCISGILPFVSIFTDIFYILSSIWIGTYYVVTEFSILAFVTLILTCAEISIFFTYLQLRREDYRWWWHSFSSAGSIGIYIFLYSIIFFCFVADDSLLALPLATYIIYFGYMALISTSVFLMMGCVGVFSSLWFNQIIFAYLKEE